MNQTQKRLEIIRLAISIGDNETVQLQILKLTPLKQDEKIQEILRGLHAENYAQTLPLISEYIQTPPEVIAQRTAQYEPMTPEEEEEIIEAFDLFKVAPEEKKEEIDEILDLEAFAPTTPSEPAEQKYEKSRSESYDALLNLTSDDILKENISVERTTLNDDDFFDENEEKEPIDLTHTVEKDDFFDTLTQQEEVLPTTTDHLDEEEAALLTEEKESETKRPLREIPIEDFPAIVPDDTARSEKMETFPTLNDTPDPSSDIVKNTTPKNEETALSYEAIPYIDQKIRHMQEQYPPVELASHLYEHVEKWLHSIKSEPFEESDVERQISRVRRLADQGDLAEAAQLLLTAASTPSIFAQFMLARSLFKGDILEKNLPESFRIIRRLALDESYPEAICDLAQMYEYGIGVEKDLKRAKSLYKEAADAGIKRAEKHFERLTRNRGLLGKLLGK